MSSPASGFTQRQAEILARWFNAALTNTGAYGGDHPVSERSRQALLDGLRDAVATLDSVTLMLDRDTLFIDDFAADGKFNASRLIKTFRDAGLQSLTFGAGIDDRQLATLLELLAAGEDLGDADSLSRILSSRGVDCVRLNHVVMRRFSADDEVVSREGLEQLTGLAEQALGDGPRGDGGQSGPELGDDLGERIEHILTLAELLEHPDLAARQVLEASRTDARARASVAARIREISGEIGEAGQGTAEHGASLREVVAAIARLRDGLQKGLAGQAEMSRLMAESGGVLDEVSRLGCRAIVSIVREEYRTGQGSAGRLADLVRRIVPDPLELKRLMPMLKRGLLEEGMPLVEFIELVNELAAELRGEGLVQALTGGADEIGIPVEEILREIRHRPGEAARVLVLAAELRQAGRPDESVFSEALADYVERVIGTGEGDAVEALNLQQAIGRVRAEIGRHLRVRGLADRVAERIESDLDRRLDGLDRKMRSNRLLALLAGAGECDDEELRQALVRTLRHKSELPWFEETLTGELPRHGFSEAAIRRLIDDVVARFRVAARISFLPGEPMDSTATTYFLEREIATCIRYRTFFSGVMLMIARIRETGSAWRAITPGEAETVMPQIFELVSPHLRDLDMLGTLGDRHRNIPIVLLPMTGEQGATAVLDRILETLAEAELDLDRARVRVEPIGVACLFDPEKTAGARAYIQSMRGLLANLLVSRLRGDGHGRSDPDAPGSDGG